MTGRSSSSRGRFGRWRPFGAGALVCAAAVAIGLATPALRLVDEQAIRVFGTDRQHPQLAAVYLSGDMGLRFGMGPHVVPALAAHGVPVIGVSSAANFAVHRTRAEVDALLADAIRTAVTRTGAQRVVLIGQSFGADMVATAAPDLPAGLRARVAAIVLVVPAQTAYFRADPTGLAYLGTPDARPAAAMRGVGWAPILCIYGIREPDSLCPALTGTARVIALPGGHFLNRDDKRLVATMLAALHAADPTIMG